ncbi:family 20 glycosylhydrolase [Algoriphagus boseongensis]|nr:family 20 glycosylhydrolase [Algoriphagus boseongensis]
MKRVISLLIMAFWPVFSFSQIKAQWELLENKFGENGFHKAQIILSNSSNSVIESGWKLYFNTIFISVNTRLNSEEMVLEHLQGDFFRIKGKEKSSPILPGESIVLTYRSSGPFLKNSYAPEGLILELQDGQVIEISDYQRQKLTVEELGEMAKETQLNFLAEENENPILNIPDSQIPPFLPIPKKWKYTGEVVRVKNAGLGVVGSPEFVEASTFLLNSIKKGYKPKVNREETPVTIRIQKRDGFSKEEYQMKLSGRVVEILASDPVGAFYGVQSFLAMMTPDFWQGESQELNLPQVEISDKPTFAYRGFFLDVARNFQSKKEILKILDLMAFYKLNVFHFNLANDEGWRIEIPGLPELTEFGSRRGFSPDEAEFLWPYYASGANPDQSSTGSGFYTMEDFKEIISYAKSLNIEVIPEIGVPAHSRAAILAMEKRYQKFMASGNSKDALEYRLADPEDTSIYLSAQNFRGNTICVCQESTYAFYEKVVSEIQKMYQSAGVELKTIHSGGDEVPRGVWTGSPICQEFLAKNPQIKQGELVDYFRERIDGILAKKGLEMAGWEEIGQSHQGNQVLPNPKFSDRNWRLHAWNAVAGWGGEDMAYRLANAGYPVVISPSSNFYFDLAYSWDPEERGHTWSGVADTYQTWKAVPMKLYLSHDQTLDGAAWDWEKAKANFTELTEKGKKNIIGVSGQLWTETVKGPEMMEYYLFPKMFGYVERAWNGDPEWSNLNSISEMEQARNQEWNVFVNLLLKRELPRLDFQFGGVKYRQPKEWKLAD